MQSPGHPPFRNRALDAEYAGLLSKLEVFAGLGRVTLAKLVARLESISVPEGAELFRQGDPGDAFYLVVKGRLAVFVASQSDATARRVNSVGPGDAFGEMALLEDHPRTATIRADTDVEVLRLERGRFLALVRDEPSVALAVARSLGRRLRDRDSPARTTKGQAEAPSTARPAARRKHGLTKGAVGLLLAAVLLAAGWIVPPPTGLSLQGWQALAATMAFIPLLATEALPDGVSALLLAGVWVLGGVASPGMALSGFSSPSWVLLVSVLVIGAAIASSGLPYRLALWTVAHSRGGFAGQVSALCVAGTILSPAVPNATARVTLVAPAIGELVEALGYTPRSRPAAGLAMAALTGCGQMVAPFLTSSTTAVLVFAVLPQTGDIRLDFLSWALFAAPANVLLLLGMIISLIVLYRPRTEAEIATAPQRETVALQRKLIGPPTRSERISLVVGIALIVGFVAQPLHGVDPAWVAAFALAALGAGRVIEGSTLTSVNWNFVLLFGMLASLANVFKSTGLEQWIGASVTGPLASLASMRVAFVAAVALLTFAVSFALRWQAAAPLITVVLSPIAVTSGIHPFVVGLVAIMASNVFFLPYQSTGYLALYHGNGGRLFTHAQARPAALAYGAMVVLSVCASVGAWRIMGLL